MLCECCNRGAPVEPKARASWEWFTGYFDRTVAFCPRCAAKHRPLVERLIEASRIPPFGGERHTSATQMIALLRDKTEHGEG
jgi:hypothetical protein